MVWEAYIQRRIERWKTVIRNFSYFSTWYRIKDWWTRPALSQEPLFSWYRHIGGNFSRCRGSHPCVLQCGANNTPSFSSNRSA
jgi:hypothetical protein